ncbi:DNA helicase MCM8 isoform X2 [Haemorhous mexicanus]|uniref:DNA helicase MCM8 isoform X2 n=1 Tax=Haemorhous mexicanus TaxID=30427 RepID=UPI0028BF04DC|nr:DNA helicase MCM8 isoform X2 [Haemorhous mexicanus]
MSKEFRGRGCARGRGFQGWRGGWRGGGGWRGRGQKGEPKRMPEPAKSRLVQSTMDQFIPYKGWKLYFSEVYNDKSPFVQKTQAFEKFFMQRIELYDKDEIERKGSILVDYKELIQDRELTKSIPNISAELRDMPQKILQCMGLAIHQVLTKDLERHAAELQVQEGLPLQGEPVINVPLIHARVYNYEPLTQLKNVRANCYGKYIALRGTVVRVSNIKPLCTNLAFVCAACGDVQGVPLPDGKYTLPTKCLVPECRGRSFTADRSSPLTTTVDWQSVNSLCPAIYGHEIVKAGLALALFGGCQKFVDDKNRIPVRGDPHVLVVGDPGLGKSQMLQAVCNIAPRGVYVCGNTSTSSGLTVTLSRDGTSGDFALEAGALVLGDQGICGIDEFDKMGNQHQALLEAMEQQSISLAKAGIVCSLPARTSIVAAANPVGGHYNKAKTVSENLKMGSALLSRFDLVFILLDTPNEDHDHLLSEHVMAMRAGRRAACSSALVTRASSQEHSVLQATSDRPLLERLKISTGENFDAIPHQLLRKYVGYARQYVHPSLSPEAAQVLQEFYLELRKQNQGSDSTPITTRQLESLIRLTEARSRLELREKSTKEDAEDVIEIMKYSMLGTYSDEFGKLDFERSQHGSGMSNRSQAKRFVSALSSVAQRTYNNLFDLQQLRRIASELQLRVSDFESFIGSLNDQGYLLKKGSRVYQLQTM